MFIVYAYFIIDYYMTFSYLPWYHSETFISDWGVPSDVRYGWRYDAMDDTKMPWYGLFIEAWYMKVANSTILPLQKKPFRPC